MKEKIYPCERGSVTYFTNEKYNAPTIVFLHGLTADHTLFEKQIQAFEKEYNLIVWDAPAHGKSRPYKPFTYAFCADDLAGILSAEGIKKALLVGQSMGGYVIQAFLKKYPEKALGFVGIDTCPFGESYYSKSDTWWLRQIEWMSRLYPTKTLVNAVAKSCALSSEGRENMKKALSVYEKKELCHLMGIGFAGFLEENCNLKIPCPVILLVGERDKTGRVAKYCKMWHEKEGYPLVVIKNAAHNSNIDNPVQVNNQIENFIKKVNI